METPNDYGRGYCGPIDDHRTVNELFLAALTECDEEKSCSAISTLHWYGGQEAVQRAKALSRSQCSHERQVGADILGQLGLPTNAKFDEIVPFMLESLESEGDIDVISSILIGLSHRYSTHTIGPALLFANHANPDIRYAAVLALTCHDDVRAINMLIERTRDDSVKVRNWATFGLGTQLTTDIPTIREALADRMDDDDTETRGEAFVGLARRGDLRVIPALLREFASNKVGMLSVEAAELIGDAQLHASLTELTEWWDVDTRLVERAIVACSPRQTQ